MKKILSAVLALVMVCSLACVAFAAGDTFVPSISYKGAPTIVKAQLVEGEKAEDVTGECLVITPVAKAEEAKAQLPNEMALLQDVYAKLNDGTMKLPTEKLEEGLRPEEVVIRDLVDITLICKEDPSHTARLAKGGKLVITFEMKGLKETDAIHVMSYKNNEWSPISDVVNNGDGTITCTFDHLCPVAFIVDKSLSDTGDIFKTELLFWTVALVASAAALVVVVSKRRQIAG